MNWAALQAHLETLGRADTDGVRIRARYTTCRCGTKTLDGLDSEVAGLPRSCSIVDLDRLAEATVLLRGVSTFTVLELPDGLRLARRNQYSIRAQRQDRPVVALHRCGERAPPSGAWRWRIPPNYAALDDPPF